MTDPEQRDPQVYPDERTGDQKKRDERAKAIDDQYIVALKAIMSQPIGRQFVFTLLGNCGVYRTIFSQNSMVMSHREGQRSIGLALMELLDRHAPEDTITMLRDMRQLDD